MSVDQLTIMIERLDRIEVVMTELLRQKIVKDYYDVDEIAEILGKATFTVREWARLGRIRAQKKASGRGKFHSWVVSYDELKRIQKEGLLAIRTRH